VDEKMVTGESLPVEKTPGEPVIAGSVVQSGTVLARATHVGEETALAKIVALIEQAQTAPPARRFADVVTATFVPFVLILALASFLLWHYIGDRTVAFAFGTSVAVLLVASPSALGIATPAALAVGVSKGADRGILIKGAESLEEIQKVDMVVFDKTGTLTIGAPAVTDVKAFGAVEAAEVLRLVASVEEEVDHPLARAVVAAARDRGLELAPVEDPRTFPGARAEGPIDEEDVHVGNPRRFYERRVKTEAAAETLAAFQDQGKTVVLVAKGGTLAGVVALADPIRPEAAPAIQELRAMGIDVALITGDNPRTAAAVSRGLGVKRIFAEISPHGKAAAVKGLRDGGHVVAMVGDGINDAPALRAADVGIAIHAGSEIAVDAAHLVLMKSDIRDVPEAIRLGRKTFRKVRQNLFWAFAYNVALLPLAAVGFLPPVRAGLANAAGSVTVAANSVRAAKTWDREER
ncbi:MAG: heavy metal translocating P-type ATPase, partial [Methanobacteriota archaeon]